MTDINRRGLLKMMGIAGAGTLAYDKLDFLLRQPVTTEGLNLLNIVSFTVDGLQVGSRILVMHETTGEILHRATVTDVNGHEFSIEHIEDIPDIPIIVRARKPGLIPIEVHSTLPAEPGRLPLWQAEDRIYKEPS